MGDNGVYFSIVWRCGGTYDSINVKFKWNENVWGQNFLHLTMGEMSFRTPVQIGDCFSFSSREEAEKRRRETATAVIQTF